MNDFVETPGQILAAERKRQDLSLADVTRQLRLSERQLRALERDDYGELPGPVFVRGFIRNYARLLRLDPQPLVDAIEPPPSAPPAAPEVHPLAEIRMGTPRVWLYGLGTVAVALLVAIYFIAQRDFDAQVTAVQTAAPKPAVPAPTLPAIEQRSEISPPTLQDDIKLVFKRESFVEIRDASGKPLLNKNNPPGSSQTVVGKPPYSLVIGNAEHVEMTYQGENIDLAPHTKGGVARLILN